MKMKNLKSLLAIVCLLSSTNVSAYDFEVGGIYYDVISLSNLTCKVVLGDTEYSGDIVIPETVNYNNRTLTVVDIADKTFWSCSDLTGITIPNTISSIGNQMFSGCRNLENVIIEDGETVLELGYNSKADWNKGTGLFYNCPISSLYLGRNISYNDNGNYGYSPFADIKTLNELTIGSLVTSINNCAFYGCISLTNVTIPNSVTKIGSSAFAYCSSLTDISLGNSVTTIGSNTFRECKNLTNVIIPNSVLRIYGSAFWGCSSLSNISIGNSVTTIDDEVFSGCNILTSITIPNSVTTIGEKVFYECVKLECVVFEDGKTVLSLGNNRSREGLFYDCPITSLYLGRDISYKKDYLYGYSPFAYKDLTELTIGNTVTEISDFAFYSCKNITSITIPNSIIKIGNDAFSGCVDLTSVTISYSVNTMGLRVFNGCDALISLYSLNATPPSAYFDTFTNNQYLHLNVFVPQESLTAYQNANVWKDFWNLQGFEYTGIENVKTNNKKAHKYYDLRGNRLDAPKRGVNIINGKKIIMK